MRACPAFLHSNRAFLFRTFTRRKIMTHCFHDPIFFIAASAERDNASSFEIFHRHEACQACRHAFGSGASIRIPELLENILLNLQWRTLFKLQCTCKAVRATISTSFKLQKMMHLIHKMEAEEATAANPASWKNCWLKTSTQVPSSSLRTIIRIS